MQGEQDIIEKASSDDIEESLQVINESNREAYRKIIPEEYFSDPVLSLKSLLDDFERMTFYVYRVRGKIARLSALHAENEETGRIRWVYLLPAFRRRGIGTALVVHIGQEAKKKHIKRLWLLANGKASWAVKFYKKLDYWTVDRIERPCNRVKSA